MTQVQSTQMVYTAKSQWNKHSAPISSHAITLHQHTLRTKQPAGPSLPRHRRTPFFMQFVLGTHATALSADDSGLRLVNNSILYGRRASPVLDSSNTNSTMCDTVFANRDNSPLGPPSPATATHLFLCSLF